MEREREEIQIKFNSRIVLGVERCTGDTTTGGNASGSTDTEVEALHVKLSTVVVLGTVKSNDFVAKDVVTGFQVLGDSGSEGEVIAGHGVGRPLTVAETSL